MKSLRKNLPSLVLPLVALILFSWAMQQRSQYRFDGSWGPNGLVRFLNTLEWKWYDLKLDLKPKDRATEVLVARIDDASLEKFGRWPWNRSVYAQLIDSLFGMGAEVVAFDAVFSESEFKKEYLYKNLTERVGVTDSPGLAETLHLSDAAVHGLAESLPGVGDQIFASGVKRNPKTVLGYFWQTSDRCALYDPENSEQKKDFPEPLSVEAAEKVGLVHLKKFVDSLSAVESQAVWLPNRAPFNDKTESQTLKMYPCPVANRSALSANAIYQGYFNSIPDRDGLFRRMPLVLAFTPSLIPPKSPETEWLDPKWTSAGAFFPSLTVQTLTALWNPAGVRAKPSVETSVGPDGQPVIKAITIPRPGRDPFRIPTMPDGSIALNFLGAQNASAYPPIGEFSLANIPIARDATDVALEKKILGGWELSRAKFRDTYKLDAGGQPLKGKVILIGPIALGVYDLRPNPVQGDAAGVYLHATALSRLLDQARGVVGKESVQFASLAVSQTLLWTLGLVLSLALAIAPALRGAIFGFATMVIFLVADSLIFQQKLYAIDSVTVVLACTVISLSIIAYKYLTEERDRAFVKGAFEKYVSPDVVSSILADPKKLNLGGQKKFLSVLFSDIRGFTSISERMEAAELAKFMNEYLSPMTDIILENSGTIDKYMGDAIMAIFGAPIEYDNHAERSTRAALGMLAKLEEMKAEWRAKGLPGIEIGIGINSGDMSVGNMGSTRIFSYTVMGDSVNLGSRLEGINKEYGTHLIVSQYTRAKLGESFVCRELDRVKVKGKNFPVTIFEVMAEESAASKHADLRQLASDFEAALALYYRADFIAAKKAFAILAASDKTSAIYAERCDAWQVEPPPTDWDGSWTMKTK